MGNVPKRTCDAGTLHGSLAQSTRLCDAGGWEAGFGANFCEAL